jgi:hypothetical protein
MGPDIRRKEEFADPRVPLGQASLALRKSQLRQKIIRRVLMSGEKEELCGLKYCRVVIVLLYRTE